jgi:hypothetical protein
MPNWVSSASTDNLPAGYRLTGPPFRLEQHGVKDIDGTVDQRENARHSLEVRRIMAIPDGEKRTKILEDEGFRHDAYTSRGYKCDHPNCTAPLFQTIDLLMYAIFICRTCDSRLPNQSQPV